MEANFKSLLEENGVEERVEVNQRHLIDKILARYSAEFTVFRELVQNSNDAGATSVRIEFQCDPVSPNGALGSMPTHATSITYKNNGRPFRDEDWRRLKSIAEGNPDETKVGFFGVGFYSLFSICEEPFVSSGDQALGFFWKGDQLFAKRAMLPDSVSEEERKWTVFGMNLREPMEVPRLNDFSRFLATCLTFTEHLMSIDAYVGAKHVVSLSKTSSPDVPLDIPPNIVRPSPTKLFVLEQMDMRNVQMTARILQEVEEEKEGFTSKIALFLGYAKPKPSKPKEYKWVQCSIFLRIARGTLRVYASEHLQVQMERTTKKRVPSTCRVHLVYNSADEYKISQELMVESRVFRDLVPFPNQGRVFIGFQTHQTTGCCVHLASHFIPTVERENMDFVDPTLAHWNQELVSMGGTLCRVVYENEVQERGLSMDQFIHIVNSLTCYPSTPAAIVSQLLSRSFFSSCRQGISVLSTKGLRPISDVRIFDEYVFKFLDIAMLEYKVLNEAKPFFDLLRDANLLRPVTVDDVLDRIEDVASDDRISDILSWAIRQKGVISDPQRNCLCSKLRYTRFASLRWFPPSTDLPSEVLPINIARGHEDADLRWIGFHEYSLAEWTQFMAPKLVNPDICVDALGVFARAFPNLPGTQQALIMSTLAETLCIPTTVGLRKPQDSYISSDLFQDLPIVNAKIPEKFLKQIGVRDHVDPQLLLGRLDSLQWDSGQLLHFLSREKLDDIEIEKLKGSKIWGAKKNGFPVKDTKCAASEVYLPSEELDTLNVAQIDVPQPVKHMSKEHRLLLRLGIQKHIPLEVIIDQAKATKDTALRFGLLEYCSKHYTCKDMRTPFLPSASGDLHNAASVFTSKACTVLGFDLLHERLVPVSEKFGVRESPPIQAVVERLFASPPNTENAQAVFDYLHSRMAEFTPREFEMLQRISFIPTKSGMMPPTKVYLAPFPLLEHVDFGAANQFLRMCGVKDEPTPVEMAEWLILSGSSMFESQPKEYLDILTRVAFHVGTLKSQRRLMEQLRVARILVGHKGDNQVLVTATEVYLVDDPVLQNIFQPISSPMDHVLETFYEHLGSRWLSTVIEARYEIARPRQKTPKAEEVHELIQTRAPLLVYDLNNNHNILPKALGRLKEIDVDEVSAISHVRVFQGKSHSQPVSACLAEMVLLISGELDFFDVAKSLSECIFKRPRLNDTLLLSTLLSTQLELLKRKGFPVDRILKITPQIIQAKKNQIVPNAAGDPKAKLATSTSMAKSTTSTPKQDDPPPLPPRSDVSPSHTEATPKGGGANSSRSSLTNSAAPVGPLKPGPLEFTKKVSQDAGVGQSSIFNGIPESPNQAESGASPRPPSFNSSATTHGNRRNSGVLHEGTPEFQRQLRQTLEDSIRSSGSSSAPATIHSAPIVEQAQATYCDVVSAGHNLTEVPQSFLPVKLYLGKSHPVNMLAQASLKRHLQEFVEVLLFISNVFGLPRGAIHVYYDQEASSVAFNRAHVLYFNAARYSPMASITRAKSSAVYTYWFMVFAHELAHNHVSAHNSDHEFYMASYAHEYMTAFMIQLLGLGIDLS